MDIPTDLSTDQRTDIPIYRDAIAASKKKRGRIHTARATKSHMKKTLTKMSFVGFFLPIMGPPIQLFFIRRNDVPTVVIHNLVY